MLTVITDLSTNTGTGTVFSDGGLDAAEVVGGVTYSESSYSNSNGASWDPSPIKEGLPEQVQVWSSASVNLKDRVVRRRQIVFTIPSLPVKDVLLVLLKLGNPVTVLPDDRLMRVHIPPMPVQATGETIELVVDRHVPLQGLVMKRVHRLLHLVELSLQSISLDKGKDE